MHSVLKIFRYFKGTLKHTACKNTIFTYAEEKVLCKAS